MLSLSRNNMNLLMWSHYTENYKGFVLGLDDTNEFFYQKCPSGISTMPQDVRYTSQRSQVKIKPRDLDYYRKTLCEKPIDWAYEEEVRIFKFFTNKSKSFGKDEWGLPVFLVNFPPELVKEIYIGFNMSAKNLEQILTIPNISQHDIGWYKIKSSKIKYDIHAEPYNGPQNLNQLLSYT